MPGALYGVVTSVGIHAGTVHTREEGKFTFDRAVDSLKVNNLLDNYKKDEKVALILATDWRVPSLRSVQLICPVRLIKEGMAVVTKLENTHGIGVDEDDTQIFFNPGRLSEYFDNIGQSKIHRDNRNLNDIVKPGDKFLYRAVPQIGRSFKAIEMMLPQHPMFRDTLSKLPISNKQQQQPVLPPSPPQQATDNGASAETAPTPKALSPVNNREHGRRKRRSGGLEDPRAKEKRSRVEDESARTRRHSIGDSALSQQSTDSKNSKELSPPSTVPSPNQQVIQKQLTAAKELANFVFHDSVLNRFLFQNERFHIIRAAINVLESGN